MAQKVNDTNGCYVALAFTTFWRTVLGSVYARGTIPFDPRRGVNKYHVIRATLESITYQVDDVLKADGGRFRMKPSALRVDGGASANNFLDAVPGGHQPGAGGAHVLHRDDRNGSSLSGSRRRLLPDQETVKQNGAIDRTFEPEPQKEELMRR